MGGPGPIRAVLTKGKKEETMKENKTLRKETLRKETLQKIKNRKALETMLLEDYRSTMLLLSEKPLTLKNGKINTYKFDQYKL